MKLAILIQKFLTTGDGQYVSDKILGIIIYNLDIKLFLMNVPPYFISLQLPKTIYTSFNFNTTNFICLLVLIYRTIKIIIIVQYYNKNEVGRHNGRWTLYDVQWRSLLLLRPGASFVSLLSLYLRFDSVFLTAEEAGFIGLYCSTWL